MPKPRKDHWSRAQDPSLLEAGARLAERVRDLPPDPRFPFAERRALYVGGFVRDALLGQRSDDADMEVYGVSPESLEALLKQIFPGCVNAVGQNFGVLKVSLHDGFEIDAAIPRRESKAGRGHKGFEVEGDPTMTVEEAARRRDFTVNAMLFDPLTDELIDPFGGQRDLADKILRVVDPKTFVDDPLRVYRAVQFSARLGFSIEKKSFALMRQMVARGDLAELSKERVTEEIKKLLLKAPRPSVGFELMRELGVIERDYPELQALIGTPQEPEWHPEGDVWIHTLMVIDQAAKIIRKKQVISDQWTEEERLQIMLGALCHDLGKPATTKPGEKHGVPRIRSLGHEEAGEEPTKRLFARWAFSQDIERAAVAIARQHLKPMMFFLQKQKSALTGESYGNAVRKLLKRIHPVSWRVLLASAEADYRGRAIPGADTEPYAAGELFAKTVSENKLDEEPTRPLVMGRDVLARGVKPGPEVGRLVERIEDARDQGAVKTREEALALLDQLLKRRKGV